MRLNLISNHGLQNRMAAVWHNVRLALRATALTVSTTFLWAIVHSTGWIMHVQEEKDLLMLSTSILACATIFAIVGALFFADLWQKLRELKNAVLEGNEHKFMLLRDQKSSVMMHIVLMVFAFAIIVQFALAEYSSIATGIMIIFFPFGSIIVFFMALHEMQGLKYNSWFIHNTPQQWFTQDAEGYFTEYRQEKAKIPRNV